MTTTMPTEAEYLQGSDLPDLDIYWYDSAKELVDMQGEPHTFEAKVGTKGNTDFTKNTGIVGKPFGVTISWAVAGELNTLPAGRYILEITATRTSDSRQRKAQLSLKVLETLP